MDALGDEFERRVGALPGVAAARTILTRPFDGATIDLGFLEAAGESPAAVDARPAVP